MANKFADPFLNDSFKVGGKTYLDPKWWGGEPVSEVIGCCALLFQMNYLQITDACFLLLIQLWVTAEKQGLMAACYFWVGSEVLIKGEV